MKLSAFLQLAQQYRGERDYAVLNELVGRLGAIEHRLLADPDRAAYAKVIEALFAEDLAGLGWGGGDEPDEVKLRRAALLRAVGGIARNRALAAEAAKRLDESWAGKSSLEANLHGTAVAITARDGDAARFDAFLAKHKAETDPSFRRRYLLALTAFEAPELARRATELALTDTVPAQEFSAYVGGLLGNRVARAGAWELLKTRWSEVEKKTGGAPMILRRVIEGLGMLPERPQFEQVRAFLAAHPIEAVKAAIAQTLERMEQDVALRERTQPELSAWLKEAR